MRAAFNTTCDIYDTPGTTILFANNPCRFVPIDQITYLSWPMSLAVAYLTIEMDAKGYDHVPMSLLAGGQCMAWDWTNAKTIAIPTGTSPVYGVINREKIDAYSTADYWRLYLLTLPFPPTIF